MAGSTFGNIFKITTWGESHGKGVGVVVDGCPAGLSLCEEDIQKFLDRRKPGQSRYTTARKEGDLVEILSGIFEGKTTGTPISLMVRNTDQRSRDYGNIAYSYRPGHADYTFDAKYGFRDYRGGGRSSGRETIGRVASGASYRRAHDAPPRSQTGAARIRPYVFRPGSRSHRAGYRHGCARAVYPRIPCPDARFLPEILIARQNKLHLR